MRFIKGIFAVNSIMAVAHLLTATKSAILQGYLLATSMVAKLPLISIPKCSIIGGPITGE